MGIPTFEGFVEPILRYLATKPGGASARDIDQPAADALGLTPEERQERIPSGLAYTWKNRCGWARDRLRRNGMVASPRRNLWLLSEPGHRYLAAGEFAASVQGVVLVDGSRLADLMIDHGVGVSARTLRVPTIDRDYFAED